MDGSLIVPFLTRRLVIALSTVPARNWKGTAPLPVKTVSRPQIGL
jgi:hypothetical protein